jgi:hypothetical protein
LTVFCCGSLALYAAGARHAGGRGLIHASTERLIGRKVFNWGTSTGGRRWQEFLALPGHAYIEIQGGLRRTQSEYIPMPAGAKWSWIEAYGPIEADAQRVHVDVAPEAGLMCPECSQSVAGYDRAEERSWRHLDTCQFKTILVCRIPRVECPAHGVRQVRVPWAEDRSRFTALFEAWAIRLLHESSLSGVAELLGLSWDEVALIQRRAVQRGLARRAKEPIRAVGIDETSFRKHFEYVTVVADLERDRVLWVGDDRRQETLSQYWRSCTREELRALRAVVMDMWRPYIAATRDCVPHGLSKIVFDRYHVADISVLDPPLEDIIGEIYETPRASRSTRPPL